MDLLNAVQQLQVLLLGDPNTSPENIGRGLGLVAWICDPNGSDTNIIYGIYPYPVHL